MDKHTQGRRGAGIAWLLAGLLLLGGCATSSDSLRAVASFSEAVGQVSASADRFLADFADGAKAGDDRRRLARGEPPLPPQDWPAQLLLPEQRQPSERERAIAIQRQAVRVLQAYADTLAALAEGRSVAAIRDDVQQLAGTVRSYASMLGTASAMAGPALALVPTLLKLAEDAANRKELARGVLQGRPVVEDMLAEMRRVVPLMYGDSVVAANEARTELRDGLRRSAAALRVLLARHGRPADTALDRDLAALQLRVHDVGRRTQTEEAMPLFVAGLAGGAAMPAAAVQELRAQVLLVEDIDRRYTELVARQRAYHGLLLRYAATLEEVRLALERVAESLQAPVDLRESAQRLLHAATELRAASDAYRFGTPQR